MTLLNSRQLGPALELLEHSALTMMIFTMRGFVVEAPFTRLKVVIGATVEAVTMKTVARHPISSYN